MEIKTFLQLFINACNIVEPDIVAAANGDSVEVMHKLHLVPHFGKSIVFDPKSVGMSGASYLYKFTQKVAITPFVLVNIRLQIDLQLKQQLFIDVISNDPQDAQSGKLQFVCTTDHCTFAQEGTHTPGAFDVAAPFATLLDTALSSTFAEKIAYFKAVYIL